MTDPVAHGMPWSVIPVLRNVGAAVQFRATACYVFGRTFLFPFTPVTRKTKGDGKLSCSSGSVWLRDDEFCLGDGMRGNCVGE